LADDFAVYARLFLRYKANPTVDAFALCVLAQRVVVEKGRQYYKRYDRMNEVASVLDRINSDLEYARSLVCIQNANPVSVGDRYPQYWASGLLGEVRAADEE